MRATCLPRLAWKGCAAEQRLLSRLGLAEAARQAELAAQEQGRRAKERRSSSGGAFYMIQFCQDNVRGRLQTPWRRGV